MIVLLDNYDSFTYNLYQYLGELGAEVRVVRNDDMSAEAVLTLGPERVVISPGPGTPDQAGISLDLILRAAGRVPLLGVCLGHQALGQAFGGRVVRAARLMHGKTSEIHHDGRSLFAGLPQPFTATRYHSLVVDRASVPDALEISAWTDDGTVMGLRHRELPLEGVQFHPESILTAVGKDLLRNFLDLPRSLRGSPHLNQPPSAAPLRGTPEGAGGDCGAGHGPGSSSPPDPLSPPDPPQTPPSLSAGLPLGAARGVKKRA